MKKITPIFVLGSARNGTTWLCNILCNHPQIVGAQHKIHWGIHESNIYKNMHYWGDLSKDKNFIRFMELYSSADYFQLVEGDKNYFYRNRPADFLEFYFKLMDQFAIKKNATHWLTKLDPDFYIHPKELNEFFYRIEKRYKYYRLIGIKREFISVFNSYLNMEGRASQHRTALFVRELLILLEGSRYIAHYNTIENVIKLKKGILLDFNKLRYNREKEIYNICKYLNLDFSSKMLIDDFKPNSSLKYKGKNNQKIIPNLELKIADILVNYIFSRIPSLAINSIASKNLLCSVNSPAPRSFISFTPNSFACRKTSFHLSKLSVDPWSLLSSVLKQYQHLRLQLIPNS